MKIKTYKVTTLDVNGNETDGYEVNDWFTYIAELPANELDDLTAFCKEHLKGDPNQYELRDEYNGFLELTHKKTGKPILQFYLNDFEQGTIK